MKDLIKKQDEEFDNLFVGVEDDGTFKRMDEANVRNFIAKVRKETAEKVCDKMIGEEIYAICGEEDDGYNKRIKEEKVIKKQIIENL